MKNKQIKTSGIRFDLRQIKDTGDLEEEVTKLLKIIRRNIERTDLPFMYLTFSDSKDLTWTTVTKQQAFNKEKVKIVEDLFRLADKRAECPDSEWKKLKQKYLKK